MSQCLLVLSSALCPVHPVWTIFAPCLFFMQMVAGASHELNGKTIWAGLRCWTELAKVTSWNSSTCQYQWFRSRYIPHCPCRQSSSGISWSNAPSQHYININTSTPQTMLMNSDLPLAQQGASSTAWTWTLLHHLIHLNTHVSHTFRWTQWQRERGFGLSVVHIIYSSLPAVTQKAIRRH